MGLNVFYFGADKPAGRPIFSLMGEKRASFEADPWRRFIPLHFLSSDRSTPLSRGRLHDRLCESNQLGLVLAHWSESEGEAKFRFSIHPQNDPEKTVFGPIFEQSFCEAELNFFNFSLDMTDLPEGSYNVRAQLTSPSGENFVENYLFDNFDNGWLSSLNERVHYIKTAEQSILKYHLFSLTRQVEKRLAQSNAAEFHEKYSAMVAMIEQCENGSSCLPEQGLFQGGFTSDVMTQRRCTMYLPKGHQEMKKAHLLVVLPPSPGTENELAISLGKVFEGDADVVVLVPQSHGFSSLATSAAANHTVLVIEWAKNLFQTDLVTLAGLGTSSDAALEASLLRPDLCQEVLLDGDKIYSDMSGISGPKVEAALDSRTNDLLYTFISAGSSQTRMELVVKSMTGLGFETLIMPLDATMAISTWLPTWFLTDH